MRRLATIVAVDIVGYSARTEADEASAAADVAVLRAGIEAACAAHDGRLFNTAGDGFMLEFGAVSAALSAAEALAQGAGPPVRVGVHLGEVTVTETGDLLGHSVNVAARLEALAEAGTVLVSADVRRALRGPVGERLVDLGQMRLDKMGETLGVFALRPQGAARARPALRRRALVGGLAAAVGAGGVAGGLWWARRPRIPADARRLYDKAQTALGSGLPEDVAQAQGFLREAVAVAPNYAEAWGALSRAYQASLLFTDPAHQAGVTTLAKAAAQRALDLDRDQPEGWATLALLAPVYRNWAEAERLYLGALGRHARDPQMNFAYGRLLIGVGRIREAVTHGDLAVSGDEFAVWHRHLLALALWSAGRMEEAEHTLDKALARWPRHYALWFLRLSLLTYTGRADQAVAMGRDVAGRPSNIPESDLTLSTRVAQAMMTRSPKDVAGAIEANAAAARRGIGYAENAVTMLSALGRLDEAFAIARAMYFGEGFPIGDVRFSTGRFAVAGRRQTYILFTPPTAPLRADPRFKVLMRDLGMAAYWRASSHAPDDPTWVPG
ncbi:MAG: hypothetical protein JWP35_3798 [Caulobacter sp.]|nr:hypothetical protein [Caulobacter sp.]